MVIIVVQRLVVTRHRRWPLRWGHMNCCQEIFQRGIYVCAGVFDILKMDKTPLIYSRSPPTPIDVHGTVAKVCRFRASVAFVPGALPRSCVTTARCQYLNKLL